MVFTLASGKISEKTFAISFPAKVTSSCFTLTTSRSNFCMQKKWLQFFSMHEIRRIDGRNVDIQTGGNMFFIGGNKIYGQKYKIRVKILGVKRSGIVIITESCGILTRFSNQVYCFCCAGVCVVPPSHPFVAPAGCCMLLCFCCWHLCHISLFWLIVVYCKCTAEEDNAYCQCGAAEDNATYPCDGKAKDDAAYCHGSAAKDVTTCCRGSRVQKNGR
jgi:hypothetical protein